ncbi:MAG: FAD-dependent oxidoreductase, partial [Firmicutes bacterium]|nr:FAD-dependent oxidoreductase [Bacillota bacterium]
MEKAPRQPMPSQDPVERSRNFQEVALGYDEETALLEASRCLNCKKPLCVSGCPVEVPIPEFISLLKEKKYVEAARKIKEKNNLPAICGRVCPQESQCEAKCVLKKKFSSVAIGRLERFAADYEISKGAEKPELSPRIGKKVAVVGAGPSGLTVAGDLARLGYDVEIFEALHAPGGVLKYGIPPFRLPRKVLNAEIGYVESLGVKIRVDVVVGKSITIDELFEEGFSAVFVGTGAGYPLFMGIPGENLNGVSSANEFLTRVNLMMAYEFPRYDTPIRMAKRVAVVGAGNVAMDSARTAKRLGSEEVYIVYRRSREEMPARAEEVEHAEEEGIEFKLLTSPVRIIGDKDGWV